MTTAAASEINFVDAEEFRSMLVVKLSGANILHAPESIDTTRAENSGNLCKALDTFRAFASFELNADVSMAEDVKPNSYELPPN